MALPLNVVEFYAGIGGFHEALKQSGVLARCKIVASIDINTNTSWIYSHNFPSTPHLNRNICGLTPEELDKLNPDVFFLSPPCQPFTRQGNQRDDKDRRTDSFFHLMHTLREMHSPPKYLLMENVKGFECSQTRNQFVSILKSLEYSVQEFLLSPNQFGVPNSRLRFYLLAKRNPLQFEGKVTCEEGDVKPSQDAKMLIQLAGGESLCSLASLKLDCDEEKCPVLDPKSSESKHCNNGAQRTEELGNGESERKELASLECTEASGLNNESDDLECRPLLHYLENLDEETLKRFLVPDKILRKYAMALDIVQPSSTHSCCFTKAYGNYAVGTGSVLQHSMDKTALDSAFQAFSAHKEKGDLEGGVDSLRALNLRYFTPKEVANLMCFPRDYGFPSELTDRQCYMALGNSLNVKVVSILIRYLLSEI